MKPIHRHFDFLAPIYDRLIPASDPEMFAKFLHLPVNGFFLDAGGGTGRVSFPLSSLVDHLVITDLSAPMLKRAKTKGNSIPIRCEAETLPFRNGFFDRILVTDALHHFYNQHQAIRELIRILKPGGWMVIEEPDVGRPLVRLLAIIEKIALMGSRFYSAEAIQKMAQGPGVTSRIIKDGRMFLWIVFHKKETY
ncbi:MAG: hypothetical protein A2V65_08635 [Deltaproteobacteria bacterium RBG_13_49_15]|nr:MAG: hypothetical protein A2V65_08635 [Deltaproteobacteria bacterium RBG_13_49_15]